MSEPSNALAAIAATLEHLRIQLAAASDTEEAQVPEVIESAICAAAGFTAARREFEQAVVNLLADCPQHRPQVLAVEAAAHAAIAAAMDAAWRILTADRR